ncbi:O-antigen ligase family protein [Psychrobacter faecalis]|uniref:O-antigen ligase family protein n=1 Tax=Psychrobacter faecalis TaxID=180588 RepID=UPI0019199072|nr:hypothetical protein [Psychrobacter faecalis]
MKVKLNNITALIAAWSILAQPLFFSITSLLGLKYEGSSESPIYILYYIAITSLSVIVYSFSILKYHLLKQDVYIIGIFLALMSIHFLWVIFDPIHTLILPKTLILFLLMGLPGYFSASTVIRLNIIDDTSKIMEVLIRIIALSIIIYAVIPSYTGNTVRNIGGASYQTLSYYSAFSFGVLLDYLTRLPPRLRFKWTNSPIYKLMLILTIISCAVGTILGGGRGAFLLITSYILLHISSLIDVKKYITNINYLFKSFISLIGLMSCFYIFQKYFWEIDFIQSGFERAIQFISFSEGEGVGIDLDEGTSGRNVVYNTALEFIDQKPLVGYGPFGYFEKTIQGHNIIIDVILQVGLIGLLVFLGLLTITISSAIKNWDNNSLWAFSLSFIQLLCLCLVVFILLTPYSYLQLAST